MLQRVAACGSVLQLVKVESCHDRDTESGVPMRCSMLHCVKRIYYTCVLCHHKSLTKNPEYVFSLPASVRNRGDSCRKLRGDKCVAVCCSVLQCVAVCCSVLQCVAVCCSVLQFQSGTRAIFVGNLFLTCIL